MPEVGSSTKVAQRLHALFRDLGDRDDFRAGLAAAQTTLLLRHEDAGLLLHLGPDGLREGAQAPRRATLVLECTSATADELWSGRLTFPAAITQGRLRIRGRVAKVLAVMPTLALAVESYGDAPWADPARDTAAEPARAGFVEVAR